MHDMIKMNDPLGAPVTPSEATSLIAFIPQHRSLYGFVLSPGAPTEACIHMSSWVALACEAMAC
jgi:hypothetical protein